MHSTVSISTSSLGSSVLPSIVHDQVARAQHALAEGLGVERADLGVRGGLADLLVNKHGYKPFANSPCL